MQRIHGHAMGMFFIQIVNGRMILQVYCSFNRTAIKLIVNSQQLCSGKTAACLCRIVQPITFHLENPFGCSFGCMASALGNMHSYQLSSNYYVF